MSDPLAGVRKAAKRSTETSLQLMAEVRKARASGLPLRAVAEAAGVTYETVRRWSSDEGR